jgi:hypothetical protein
MKIRDLVLHSENDKFVKGKHMLKSLSFTALFLFGMMIACDLTTSADPDPVSITRIKEVIATPDTVTYGDTVRVHCVLENNGRPERWVYTWGAFEEEFIIPINGSNRNDTAIVLWDTSQLDEISKSINFVATVIVDDPNNNEPFVIEAIDAAIIYIKPKE